jgi:sugar/nucleoside kinase (ribokinase family)
MSGGARIGCIGELLVEFVAASRNGGHRRMESYSGPYPSGAPGIFIDQAARVGGACIFVGTVGDDAFGEVVRKRLDEDGVDASLIKIVKGAPTGTAFVSYNDDGSRDFVYNISRSAAAEFDADDATIAALADFELDAMPMSGSALGDAKACAKILRVCKALHAGGVKISFDPNVRKELIGDPAYFDAVGDLMAISAIFLPSEDDAATLFPGEALASFAPKLFARGAEFVVLKKGEKGVEGLSAAGERLALEAHAVDVRDPTGAGDCFCGAFVTLIASGACDFRKAMILANAAGALAVTKVGPMEGASPLSAIEAFLRLRS